jgi:hypothetical protein
MSGGEWTTNKDRKQQTADARELIRAQKRQLTIQWSDSYWLAQNHPCDDAVLVWLSENRQEASKIGANRWNLETLPDLVAKQAQLRKAEKFQEILARASISHQTLTAEAVLKAGGFPQVDSVEKEKAAHTSQRPRRKDAGIARKSKKGQPV